MDYFIKTIKGIINLIMTLILILGTLFVLLFVIGIKPYVVISGSMEPSIQRGSLSFINTHSKYEDVEKNDVIAYIAPSGAKVTHRVVNITENGIETKGDRNSTTDGISATKENFIGKNMFSIPRVGYAVELLQTLKGKVVLLTFVFVILFSSFLMDDKKEKIKVEC